MVWPSALTRRRPRPSLPVPGTESPPVATMSASALRLRPSSVPMRQALPSRVIPVTVLSGMNCAPLRRASASRPSRTSRALFEAGNSLPDSASSTSARPSSCSKNARCSASGQERTMLRRVAGEESVTKRFSSRRAGRILQRPPPLMRIFRPPSRVLSSSSVVAPARAANTAAIIPAAPPPITATVITCGEYRRGCRLGERSMLNGRSPAPST